jgi:hypothetical protein
MAIFWYAAQFIALMMEAVSISEMLLSCYQPTWHIIPEDNQEMFQTRVLAMDMTVLCNIPFLS